MPRLAIDYSKTIMYRIVCRDPNIIDCYVGATTDFKTRIYQHKTVCNNCNNIKSKRYHYYVYQFIRDNGGWDNWDILEIEKYTAIDKADQARRERYWLETYRATLNKIIPSRTEKEHRDDNREQKKENSKKYYQKNKEQLLENVNKYRDENREQINKKDREKITCKCGCICSRGSMPAHKKSKKHLENASN